jgi:Zn-dependent protease with chaperone function
MSVDFFIEMSWKSALIAGAALILAGALKSRSAADRAAVLRVGVAGLLLLPAISLWLPALQIEAWAAPEIASVAPADTGPIPEASFRAPLPALGAAETTIWDDPTPLVLIAYVSGLLMAVARLLAGMVTLRRWTAAGRAVGCTEWTVALERARWAAPNGERLRLLVSDLVPSPLSWGWRNPVILIDPDTLDDPEGAGAILAHEVAHIARRDWPVLMLSRVAGALFWFNPLVWRLEREVVQQAEEAADFEALDCVEPSRYAETLLSWASANGALPANSIAPSDGALARRIRAVLDGRLRSRPTGSAWTAIAILACIGIAGPVSALQLVQASSMLQAPSAPSAPLAPAPLIAASAPAARSSPAATAGTMAAVTVTAQALQAETPLAPPAPPEIAPAPAAPAPPHMAAPPQPPRGPRALVPVEMLVAMRIHGVDASYVAELAAIGPAYARLTPDEMIGMRIQGVTARYIREMIGLGYRHLTPEQLTAMRIHGVTARQGRRAIDKEGRLPSADRLVEMAIHGDI